MYISSVIWPIRLAESVATISVTLALLEENLALKNAISGDQLRSSS